MYIERMENNIKAVVFDWGGVLMEEPTERMFAYFAKKLGIDLDTLRKTIRNHLDIMQSDDQSEERVWEIVCRELGCEVPEQKSLWFEALEKTYLPYPEVVELAKRLRKEYKTGLLSNTEDAGVKMIKQQGLEENFDKTVYSCVVGLIKPDEKIYQIMLKKLRVKAEEAVFIDDKKINIEGAKKAGMKGLVFLNYQKLIQDLKLLGVKTE